MGVCVYSFSFSLVLKTAQLSSKPISQIFNPAKFKSKNQYVSYISLSHTHTHTHTNIFKTKENKNVVTSQLARFHPSLSILRYFLKINCVTISRVCYFFSPFVKFRLYYFFKNCVSSIDWEFLHVFLSRSQFTHTHNSLCSPPTLSSFQIKTPGLIQRN